jgi:hypothetical protein
MLWSELAVDVTELNSYLPPDDTETQTFTITKRSFFQRNVHMSKILIKFRNSLNEIFLRYPNEQKQRMLRYTGEMKLE